jgi:hypothetical protein
MATNIYTIFFIKILSIFYVTFLAALFGLFISQIFDKFIFHSDTIKTDNQTVEKTPLHLMLFKTFFILGLYGVFGYFFRNIITKIPFPLDGVAGFKYLRVKELTSGSVFLIVLFTFSETIIKLYLQIKKKFKIYY